MKTLLTILLFICLGSVSFSQTYYPEWKYTKLTLTGNAGTATLNNKYVGSEMEVVIISDSTTGLNKEPATITIKNHIRIPNSSTFIDSFSTGAIYLDSVNAGTALLPTVFGTIKIPDTGIRRIKLLAGALDKVVFTKDAATTNVVTLYIRQRVTNVK